ncbi:MAG: histidinol-phosphate transaminase [Myxococcota bacterium]
MRPLAPEYIRQLDPYIPGQSIPDLIKLASNENPFGPSPKVLEAIRATMSDVHLYPVAHRKALKEKICDLNAGFSLRIDQIVLGNGSTELITLLVRSLVGPEEIVMTGWPSFLMYRLATRAHNRVELAVPLTPELEYDLDAMAEALHGPDKDRIKIIFLANPNNPTGRYISAEKLDRFLVQVPPQVVVVLDEAYIEYANAPDYPNGLRIVATRPRTVVLRTFSKAYGLAGLRIAYAACDPAIAELLQRVRDPFNVNSLAQAAALAALNDQEYLERSIRSNASQMALFFRKFDELGIKATPSAGNFVLAHFGNAAAVHESLIDNGIIVRPVANYGLTGSLRITVGRPLENEALFTALKSLGS